jgi:hypothetical protein
MGEMLMLAVSELAEALEETRMPEFDPVLVYSKDASDEAGVMDFLAWKIYFAELKPNEKPLKPDGFPIELADCVIRLAETACAAGIEIHDRYVSSLRSIDRINTIDKPPLGHHLMAATASLGRAFTLIESTRFFAEPPVYGKLPGFATQITDCIARIERIAEICGFDLEAAIWLKHTFNLTRAFRHGNKRS